MTGVIFCYNIIPMKRLIFVGALFGSLVLCAADSVVSKVAKTEIGPESDVELEKDEAEWFSAGFDVDLFSAYVFRNAVINDELVLQPCVWIDLTLFGFLNVGGNAWQNWNLTNRMHRDVIPNEMNENDFNLHVGADIWQSDDEEYALNLQLRHDWFTFRYDFPNENELGVRAEFRNPFVGIYAQYAQAYHPVSACHFEVGLAQDWTVGELLESENDCLNRLSVGLDWNVNFASGRFFTNYIYGPVPGAYDPESGVYDDECMSDGIGGTTIRGNLAYEVCDHFTIGLVLAFSSTLSGEARDAIEYMGHGGSYKDCVWGGLQAKLDF